MDRKVIIAALVAAVVFGAFGFGGGVLLGRSSGGARSGNFAARLGQNGSSAQNRFQRGGVAAGQVTDVSKDSFTVKMPDGSSRIVYVSPSTVFEKTVAASIADVSKDETVTAVGSATSGGDVTAQRVQIGGGFGVRGFGGPQGGQGGAPGSPGSAVPGQ